MLAPLTPRRLRARVGLHPLTPCSCRHPPADSVLGSPPHVEPARSLLVSQPPAGSLLVSAIPDGSTLVSPVPAGSMLGSPVPAAPSSYRPLPAGSVLGSPPHADVPSALPASGPPYGPASARVSSVDPVSSIPESQPLPGPILASPVLAGSMLIWRLPAGSILMSPPHEGQENSKGSKG